MVSTGPAFISGIGVWEILVILVVALLIFGHRLPAVARSVGKGYLEFRRGLKTLENQIDFGEADIDVWDKPKGGRGESAPKPPAKPEADRPADASNEPEEEPKKETPKAPKEGEEAS
jgi:sec-independent protein translocase protein TatA